MTWGLRPATDRRIVGVEEGLGWADAEARRVSADPVALARGAFRTALFLPRPVSLLGCEALRKVPDTIWPLTS